MRIAVYRIVVIHAYALTFQPQTVVVCRTLTGIMGDYYAGNHKSALDERFAKTQHILVVGNTQVLTNFVSLDVLRRQNDDDLQQVTELREHPEFAVRHEPGQHTARVHVVEQLAAQFEVQLVAELSNPFAYMLRLNAYVLVVIKCCHVAQL